MRTPINRRIRLVGVLRMQIEHEKSPSMYGNESTEGERVKNKVDFWAHLYKGS